MPASDPSTTRPGSCSGSGTPSTTSSAGTPRSSPTWLRSTGPVGAGGPGGAVEDEEGLVRSLLAHLAAGTGGEHFVASAAALAGFAARFEVRATLGGTNVRAALAMRALGQASTVHLVSTGPTTYDAAARRPGVISSARHDSFDPHVVVQFPAGATVRVGDRTVVAPSANRVIYVNDLPNRSSSSPRSSATRPLGPTSSSSPG